MACTCRYETSLLHRFTDLHVPVIHSPNNRAGARLSKRNGHRHPRISDQPRGAGSSGTVSGDLGYAIHLGVIRIAWTGQLKPPRSSDGQESDEIMGRIGRGLATEPRGLSLLPPAVVPVHAIAPGTENSFQPAREG